VSVLYIVCIDNVSSNPDGSVRGSCSQPGFNSDRHTVDAIPHDTTLWSISSCGLCCLPADGNPG